MHLKQLASQTDRAEFQRLYHDPKIHTAVIAALYDIKQSRLSEFAHLLEIPTRREVGVCFKPTLLRATPRKDKLVGRRGCTGCLMLARCKIERLWLDTLPCETQLDFEVGADYETDSSPTLWVMPLEVRVNVEAIG